MKLIRSLIILVFTTPALTKNISIERQIEKSNNFNDFLKTQTSSLSTPLGTGTPITSIPTFLQSTSTKTFYVPDLTPNLAHPQSSSTTPTSITNKINKSEDKTNKTLKFVVFGICIGSLISLCLFIYLFYF